MLLAAGRGERMRPLTDVCPKPLLRVQGKPLMQWHLEALARGGFDRVVVNTAWLGDQVTQTFNDVFSLQPLSNKREQLSIAQQLQMHYSHEGHDFGAALETAGGICRALPVLCPPLAAETDEAGETSDAIEQKTNDAGVPGQDVFWVLAGDVFTPGFEFTQAAVQRFIASDMLAHLWLVPNPGHNLRGDFGLDLAAGRALGWPPQIGLALNFPAADPRPRFTYSTIGLYRRALFEPPWCDIPAGNPHGIKAALAPLLRAAMDQGQVSAELYAGDWTDVGTPERLAQLNAV